MISSRDQNDLNNNSDNSQRNTVINENSINSNNSHLFFSKTSEVYFKFFSEIEHLDCRGEPWILKKRQHQLNKLFETLQIDTTLENWRLTIDSHKVIMNRRPKNDKLVIGCGNLPNYSEEVGDVYFIDNYGVDKFTYRALHSHTDADTIDPDPARNPTFVAEFGLTPMYELFKGHTYKEIIIEGIKILPWERKSVYPFAVDSLIALLDEKGIVSTKNKSYTKIKLEEYRNSSSNISLSSNTNLIQSKTSEIYFKFFSEIEKPNYRGEPWILKKRQHQLNKLFETLQINTTPENWRLTIDSHKVIMNRWPNYDKLVINCGNLPSYSEKVGDVYFIDNYGGDKFTYRALHSHTDADTIDPDLARNPTFVADFGKTPMHELFKEHTYKEIIIERINTLPWERKSVGYYPYTIDSLIALLDEKGIVRTKDNFYSKIELEEYRLHHPTANSSSSDSKSEQQSLSPVSSTVLVPAALQEVQIQSKKESFSTPEGERETSTKQYKTSSHIPNSIFNKQSIISNSDVSNITEVYNINSFSSV